MRFLYLFLMLIISGFSYGQFLLEHTYDNVRAVRINLGINGEKYYQFDKTSGVLTLFNADHSLWKEVHLPLPETTYDTSFWFVTDDFFNEDDKIEIAYTYFFLDGETNAKEGKIINEDGDVLLTVSDGLYFKYLQIDGLRNKFIASLSNNINLVYSSSLVLEHTYPAPINRIKLENSGEKYYYVSNGNRLRVYNSDHSLWKTILLPHPTGSFIVSGISLLSELINSDGLLKVGYSFQTQGENFSRTYEGRIIDEEGQLLLTVPNGTVFKIDSASGVTPKLLVSTQYYQSTPVFYDFTSMKVYSLPELQMEHDYYPDRMSRANFGISGEKYYSSTFRTNHIDLYNADHSLWKTINFTNDGLPVTGTLTEISQKTLNNDALIEVAYNYYSGDDINCKVVNELGAELLEIPMCNSIVTSKIDGLEDKLIAQLFNLSENVNIGTKIYQINSTLHAETFDDLSLMLYPNPASSEISVNSKIDISKISIYNSNAQLVANYENSNVTQFSVSDLSKGLYLLQLTDEYGKISTHKVVISR